MNSKGRPFGKSVLGSPDHTSHRPAGADNAAAPALLVKLVPTSVRASPEPVTRIEPDGEIVMAPVEVPRKVPAWIAPVMSIDPLLVTFAAPAPCVMPAIVSAPVFENVMSPEPKL